MERHQEEGRPNYDVVTAVAWGNGNDGTVSLRDVLGRRCLALAARLPDRATGWATVAGGRGGAVQLGGDVRVYEDMDNVTVVAADRQNATVWLCTTRSGGLSLAGVRAGTMRLPVGIAARCGALHVGPAQGPALVLVLTTAPEEARAEEKSTAVTATTKSMGTTREAVRLSPMMQRAGGGACGADGPGGAGRRRR